MNILVINGPNLNLLGIREPDLYGKEDYAALVALVEDTCAQEGIGVEVFQSNHEGAIVDKIQQAYWGPLTASSSTPPPTPTPAWPSWMP